jgi:hypothetical protein
VLTKTTHLFGGLQVLSSLPVTVLAMGMIAGPSSSDPEGMEPLSKKAHHWSFLRVLPQYAWSCPPFMPLLFLSLDSKCDF